MTATDQLSRTFGALSDPTRRAILMRLAEGEATVTELAAPFEMSLPAVSKHLKVLERAGLITRGREAQWRPAKLDPEPLKQASNWLDEYHQFWDESFDQLDEYLAELQRAQQREQTPNEPEPNGSMNGREHEPDEHRSKE